MRANRIRVGGLLGVSSDHRVEKGARHQNLLSNAQICIPSRSILEHNPKAIEARRHIIQIDPFMCSEV